MLRGNSKTVVGIVSSNKMQKTITVVVERRVLHPRYHKYIRRSSKLHAHDEKSEARVGDTVRIIACRPLSKIKSWRLLEVIRHGHETAEIAAQS